MQSWRASNSRQPFSAIFSYSACTAPEVTDGENEHAEEGDRRDARGHGEKMQRAALEPDEREAEHGNHRGAAARDAARAGGDPEYRRRGTRETAAAQCPRRAAEGKIAIAAPEGEVQPEQRRNEEDAPDVGNVHGETPLGAAVRAAGREPEQCKVRKLRELFAERRLIGGEVFGQAPQPRIEGVEVERLAHRRQ